MVQARLHNLSAQRLAAAQPVLMAANGLTGASLNRGPANQLWVNTWGYTGHDTSPRTSKVDHDGQFGSHYRDHAGSLRFSTRF